MESRRIAAIENNVWLQVLSSDEQYYRKTGMVRNLGGRKRPPRESQKRLPILCVT